MLIGAEAHQPSMTETFWTWSRGGRALVATLAREPDNGPKCKTRPRRALSFSSVSLSLRRLRTLVLTDPVCVRGALQCGNADGPVAAATKCLPRREGGELLLRCSREGRNGSGKEMGCSRRGWRRERRRRRGTADIKYTDT